MIFDRLMSRTLDILILLYQIFISPLLSCLGASQCIYKPSCSQYAREALKRHGLVRGLKLGLARVSRCRPGQVGGQDLVPNKRA